jgi:hypothetical protein
MRSSHSGIMGRSLLEAFSVYDSDATRREGRAGVRESVGQGMGVLSLQQRRIVSQESR